LLYFSTDKQQTYWSEQRLQPCDAHNQCFQKHNVIEALQCLYKYPQELLYILICDAFTWKGTSKIILCFIASYVITMATKSCKHNLRMHWKWLILYPFSIQNITF